MFGHERILPPPDDTPVGDLWHVLCCYQDSDDDMVVLRGTIGVYGEGVTTGLSLGDLRQLFVLARLGERVQRLVRYAEVVDA